MTEGPQPGDRGLWDRASIYALRLAGALLALLVVLPAYRLLARPDAGLFLRGAIAAADLARTMLLVGSFIALAVAAIASRLIDPSSIDRTLARFGNRLAAIPAPWFAGALAVVSASLALGFSLVVLHGKPNLIDAMVQLVHARFIAAGHLAGPADQFTEFWQLQNSLVTPNGWVSQYPPGYVVFLSIGMRLGMVQAVGPVFVGMAVLFTALAAERLLRDDRGVGRLGVVMLALSPFLLGLAGAFMNHVGAAAFTSAAIYFGTRARDSGKLLWAALAGAAVGGIFSIRPLTAVVAALVVAAIWLTLPASRPRDRIAPFFRLTAAASAGISPILVAIGAYNKHFFGSALRFGYIASQGPLIDPGFHRDPTGQFYGPVQALGYTSSDLVTLSQHLLETPIPAVLVVGLYLLFGRRLSPGERIIALWALLPVVANASYWHHGLFMGPRMLNEAAPAWALLTAIAAVCLVRRIPPEKMFGNYSPRAVLALAFGLSWCAGIFYLGPERLASYGGPWMASSRMEVPHTREPSLVFVHGAWTGRVATRLVAHGMRVDSLEAAMRQNTTCDTHNFAIWYSANATDRPPHHPPLDFSFVPHNPPPQVRIADGDDIRAYPGVPMSPACFREVASDTLGIIDIGPLVWQGDLPVIGGEGAMIVRDMGPEDNARLIRKYPDRVPEVLLRHGNDKRPKLLPYTEGMKLLWLPH